MEEEYLARYYLKASDSKAQLEINEFYFIFCFSVLGQKTDISICRGSTSVNKNVSYALNFLGKKKIDALNLFGYCNFPNISNNYIWLNFTPNSYGNLDIVFGDKPDSLTVFIFECKTNDIVFISNLEHVLARILWSDNNKS